MAKDMKPKRDVGPAHKKLATDSPPKKEHKDKSHVTTLPTAVPSPKPKKRRRESRTGTSEDQIDNHGVKESIIASPANTRSKTQITPKSTVSANAKKTKKDRSDGSEQSQRVFSDVSKAPSPLIGKDESTPDIESRSNSYKSSKKRKNQDVGEIESEINGASEHHQAKVRKHKYGESAKSAFIENETHAGKHASILKKFEKSIKTKKPSKKDAEKAMEEITQAGTPVVAHGLEPLPQPEPMAETGEKPTYSTMPNWITNPVTRSAYERDDGAPVGFDGLKLDKSIVSKLRKHGYTEATPVQATVIPLLIDNAHRHKGDLCVSASTGSGKTLSYVLPMDQSLQRESIPRLRGLIVVPTRELVKQAREAFEACGSNLRIGTALGHVPLKDEQQKLIQWDPVYNPDKYEDNQQKKMSADDWASFDILKYREEVERNIDILPGYIQTPRPSIDVLISTPGRLVDHIRQTEGFTLRHLEWLVVDEADRLLNESFQEWVSVLIGTLDKEKTANIGGPKLANIGRPLQSQYPKKVVLSATLTNDITKLNSLHLENPKLVAIGSRDVEFDKEGASRESEQFVLPPKLVEHVVPVGDGSEKPVHLMKLLLQEINQSGWSSVATPAYISGTNTRSVEEDSSSDATSSESDYTSSSGDDTSSAASSDSESDSDSNSESDTSSEATSDSGSGSETETSSNSDSDSDSESSSINDESNPAKGLRASDTGVKSVLIFTKSTESAGRLSHLLGLMNPALKPKMGVIVKSSNSSSSRKTLKDYRAGRINIIVATDRASRGIDLVGLDVVVNYDVPTSLTTYVHRVGRTARAGRSGHAWTLLEHREGLWFQKVVVKSDNVIRSGNVLKYSGHEKNTKAMIAEYTVALGGLEKAVKG